MFTDVSTLFSSHGQERIYGGRRGNTHLHFLGFFFIIDLIFFI
jgi:hypothetical protein